MVNMDIVFFLVFFLQKNIFLKEIFFQNVFFEKKFFEKKNLSGASNSPN